MSLDKPKGTQLVKTSCLYELRPLWLLFTSSEPLTGDPVADRTTMIRTIAEEKGWTQQQVKDWLQTEQLSLHHSGGNDFQLIPWDLHGNRSAIPPVPGLTHQGGAYGLRNQ
jgi:hypothetical protein